MKQYFLDKKRAPHGAHSRRIGIEYTHVCIFHKSMGSAN